MTTSADRPGWSASRLRGLGLLARGPSLRDAFAGAALGMFALMAGPTRRGARGAGGPGSRATAWKASW